MAVKDVFRPGSTNPIDPKNPKGDEGKESEWEKKRRDAKAEREYIEEQRRIDRINQPETPSESPFKISGGINLGNIDVQEQQRQATEAAEKTKKDADDKVERVEKERDVAREKLHQSEMQNIQTALSQKIENLEKAIQSGATDKKSFAQEVEEIQVLAKTLGMAKPESPSNDDPTVKIEIMKLQMQESRADREFKRQMRADEKQWTLELRKLDLQVAESGARLRAEQEKNQMFANLPQVLGGAIAQGLISNEGSGGVSKEATSAKGKREQHIEADWGEAGETACPGCGKPIAIGPTAKIAICANPECNTRVPIKRVGEKGKAPSEEE